MKSDLFNSTFEMELRIATLLCVGDKALFSVERILALDFISCYASDFELSNDNLHGNNSFMFSELSSRRNLISEAIKPLVYKGLVEVEMNRGYFYRISEIGKSYILSLESEYAKEYMQTAEMVIKELGNYSDDELMRIIQFKAGTKMKEAE